MFVRKLIAVVIVTLACSACVRVSQPPAASQFVKQPWSQRQQALQQFKNWRIKGVFSVKQQQQRHTAHYDWQQNGKDYRIRIYSSLGLYQLRIDGHAAQVVLYEGEKTMTADSAEALFAKRLGWVFPVSNLSYWIRGLPAPNPEQQKQDAYGHLVFVAQQGWQVTLSRYTHLGDLDLPQTVDLQGHGLTIRIVIQHWS